ncbi:hypothetical protein Theco_4067 (plasmid) [Thermobacillus composti KWC4]|jgi:predicted RNase H-like HicB family nuclease|uniref:HicB-like antitoxin of toxin-antitoxin system domain-containing protein n=1 Tax=Thermobacillus composti (strain DSM 18247 / JCM 13945 / KWC4) TaxID=717605 RepID=L0EKK8_THECK|nr:type II toxin-antitoxin system HicB family antitoxin [Thermobacillus composti]AGA60067.1 hypothetical protein Theco_4067 [Thermobacillus composti KWC4]
MSKMKFTVMIEEDKAEGDFTAYIPAIRLGARGETLEEVRKNAIDLLEMEIESAMKRGQKLPVDCALLETIEITLPVKN